jgi:hypothetical protein
MEVIQTDGSASPPASLQLRLLARAASGRYLIARDPLLTRRVGTTANEATMLAALADAGHPAERLDAEANGSSPHPGERWILVTSAFPHGLDP